MKRIFLAAALVVYSQAKAQVAFGIGVTVPAPVYMPPPAPSDVVQAAPPAPLLE
jgi:hypothetical protein